MYRRDCINLSWTNWKISNCRKASCAKKALGMVLHIDLENNAIQDKTIAPTVLFTRSHLHYCSQHPRLSNTIANWPKATLINTPKFTPLMITPCLFPFSRWKAKSRNLPWVLFVGWALQLCNWHRCCTPLTLIRLHQFWLSGKEVETTRWQGVQDEWCLEKEGVGETKDGSRMATRKKAHRYGLIYSCTLLLFW